MNTRVLREWLEEHQAAMIVAGFLILLCQRSMETRAKASALTYAAAESEALR